MFCRHCGNEIPDRVSFCPSCGGQTQSEQPAAGTPGEPGTMDYPSAPTHPASNAAPTYGQTAAYPNYQPVPTQTGRSNKRLIIIIAAAGALLVAAGILLAVLLLGSRGGPDIGGTWEGTLAIDETSGDPELRDTDLDLIGKTTDATLIFDMDDDQEGLLELYFDDDPDQMIKMDVVVKGKKVQVSGRMFGNEATLSGTVKESKDVLTLLLKGSLEGRDGEMSIEMDIEQKSSRKNRPEGSDTQPLTEETSEPTEPFDTDPVTTITEPEPTQTTPDNGAVDTTAPTQETTTSSDYYSDPALIAQYLQGKWFSDVYPDGTCGLFVFHDAANVSWYIAYPGQDTSSEGYRSGNWIEEFVSDGQYTISGNRMTITWVDFDGYIEEIDIMILDENHVLLTILYEDENYEEYYERVELR